MIALLAAAITAGALGSLHCAGMCGPLVAAGATEHGRVRGALVAQYLLGRATSYAFVGAAMGALGEHALCRLPVAAVQLTALALAIGFAAWKGAAALWPAVARRAGASPLLALVARHLPRRGLGLGLVTGFLPCAMLVPAWLMAASSGSAPAGAATLLAFFAGGVPALVAPLLGVRVLARRAPSWLQGAAWWALAAVLAVRPLLMSAHHH